METHSLSLYELLGGVKDTLREHFSFAVWVTAEISEIKVNYSGHCYLELIEKDAAGESVRARARATIWASVYRMVKPYFETAARSPLTAGMKIMVKASVEFHELYGLSLNITDIEPSYTIGEMALRRQEVINKLIAEGVFEMNKMLPLADLPQKIAVISSKTAAGYGDFMDQLHQNDYGYKFYVKLFPAVMQGAEAEQSIIRALDAVHEWDGFFDAVVIIRGGGSQADLNCFNSYLLASYICQFPVPVLTGIGHEQDETIADMVAHTRLKTPTAVAEFLVASFREADVLINQLSDQLLSIVKGIIEAEKKRFSDYAMILKPSVKQYLGQSSTKLNVFVIHLKNDSRHLLTRQKHKLGMRHQKFMQDCAGVLKQSKHSIDLLEKRCSYLDPFQILKRGYSVTYFNGKSIKDPFIVPANGEILTRLAGGMMKSKKND